VAPFHPLRDETRVLAARLLAAVAIFVTIALVLLAGSSTGPLASAEADPGSPNGKALGQVEGGPPQANGVSGGAAKKEPVDPALETPTSTPEGEPVPAPSAPAGDTAGKSTGSGAQPAPTGGGAKDKDSDKPETPPGQVVAETPVAEAPAAPTVPAVPTSTSLGAEPGSAAKRKPRREVRRLAPRSTGSTAGGVAGTEIASTPDEPAPAAGAGGFGRVGRADDGSDGSAGRRGAGSERVSADEPSRPLIERIFTPVEVVPDSLKAALAGLAALSILLGLGYLFAAMRNRSLARQRRELLTEVGLLQSALLPPVPERVGSLRTSVAYRPADGPGAGGDFYDVLPLSGGRVGFILGDVSGHGRGALARTAFMRYTLRAYLEAGLEPRVALQVAGRVIDENLGGDFATVLLAVHDPETGSLTYSTAGHPAPLVVGPQPHDPVTAGSSPPIGVGVRTGLRQTTVPLVPGSVACMFTDGLMEARVDGGILGRDRLEELLEELGRDATARGLIDSVHRESRVLSDDIAAVVVQPTNGSTAGLFRTEQLELSDRELEGPTARRFLEACGVADAEADAAVYDARTLADRFGGVILHVVFGNRLRVEVLPRNVESIEAASRRAAAR
jgi:Stage II sporulation protein E (SpoIIE)